MLLLHAYAILPLIITKLIFFGFEPNSRLLHYAKTLLTSRLIKIYVDNRLKRTNYAVNQIIFSLYKLAQKRWIKEEPCSSSSIPVPCSNLCRHRRDSHELSVCRCLQ